MGRNNSGKSSILEALYLASAAFKFQDSLNRADNKIEYLLNRQCERGLKWLGKKQRSSVEQAFNGEISRKLSYFFNFTVG